MIGTVRQNCLRDLREESGLTLQQIAQSTGLATTTVLAIENDERGQLTLGSAVRLARLYNLTVEEFGRRFTSRSVRK
jgi:transcriptional regulator with XRE-family HTH domain